MKSWTAVIFAVLFGALSGCGGGESPSQQVATDKALIGTPPGNLVAMVNGESITQPLLDVYAKGHGFDLSDAKQRQAALDSLIDNIVLAQALLGSELATQPEVQAEASLVRMQQLSGREMSTLRSAVKVTDQELRAYYDSEVKRTGDKQYRLQHILFSDESSAVATLLETQAEGADFVAIMQAKSASALQAKELDWGHLGQMPPEFATVVPQVADGTVVPTVVKTSFGYHVLRRAESRPFAPPSFDSVKEGARAQLIQQAVADQVKALRSKAKITSAG
jgi:peptidyl-prolyl cis-trans isomerase C